MAGAQYMEVFSPVEDSREGSLLWKYPSYVYFNLLCS